MRGARPARQRAGRRGGGPRLQAMGRQLPAGEGRPSGLGCWRSWPSRRCLQARPPSCSTGSTIDGQRCRGCGEKLCAASRYESDPDKRETRRCPGGAAPTGVRSAAGCGAAIARHPSLLELTSCAVCLCGRHQCNLHSSCHTPMRPGPADSASGGRKVAYKQSKMEIINNI